MASKIRILFLSANPEGTTKLKVIEEFKLIDTKIQASEYRDQFDLEQSHAVSLMELQTLFLRFKPTIVHFSGHGSETGALVFENHDGSPEEAPPNALSALFRIINEGGGLNEHHIQCVLLSACYSLRQAKAISKHVDCVIGITDAIKDKSATNFAASFYQALGYGRSVQSSFDLGLNQLGLVDDTDQNILKLVHKKDVNPSKIFLVSNAKSTHPTDVASIQNPEDVRRAKNLSFHCTQLLTKLDLESNYFTPPSVELPTANRPPSDPVRSQYWVEFLEHVCTGHRELYETTLEFRKRMSARDNTKGFVKQSILTIFQELHATVPNHYDLNRMAMDITITLAKGKWEKFTWKHDVNRQCMLEWEQHAWEIKDVDDELAEKICSALNDFFLEKNQLIMLYQRKEAIGPAEKQYSQSIKGFITMINTGTTSLGGACEDCLSSNFHNEKTIIKYGPMLTKFREEWARFNREY